MDVAGGQEESALVTVELDPGDTGDNDNQGEKQEKKKPTTQVMVGSGGNGKTRTPMHGAAEGREKRGKGD